MWEIKSYCERHQWASYESEPCPYCARERVPAIVRDLDEQVAPDLKNAFDLAKDLFSGNFFERHGFTDKKVTEVPSYPSQKPAISVPVATDCKVCGGVRKVGAPGFQVPCPSCSSCPTCQGRGMVGMPGHEVACPACSKPR